jgi:non-ribosomal peptide synthetase component F
MDRAGTEIASANLSLPRQESRKNRYLVGFRTALSRLIGRKYEWTEANDDPAYIANETSYLAHVRSIQEQSWPAEVPRKPVYPLGERPISEYLREWALRTPAKAAINFYGRETSYAELDRLSDRFAALITRLGATKGDRIAVFLPNCPQFIVCFYGILKAGCVHVPVNPMFTEPELAYELNNTGIRIIVVHDQLLPVLEAVKERSSILHILQTSLLDVLPAKPEIALPANLNAERRSALGAVDLIQALADISEPRPM